MSDKTKLHLSPNLQVFQINSNLDNRKSAESRKVYHHFCSLNALEAILRSQAIKFNNIANFGGAGEYERKNVDPDFWGQIFIACLTNNLNSNELWNDFGDNGKGVRIDFTFSTVFHIDVLDEKRLVRSFGIDGKESKELGFSVSAVSRPGLTCNPNRFTEPIVDISLMDVAYRNTPKIDHVFLKQGKALNMSSVSTEIPSMFQNECETRVRGILRCTQDVYIDKISYLLVPIKLKYMNVTFGKRVDEKVRRYYLDMLNTRKSGEK